MNEVKMLLRLAKTIRTPKQAVILIVGATVVIVIAYVIPSDALD